MEWDVQHHIVRDEANDWQDIPPIWAGKTKPGEPGVAFIDFRHEILGRGDALQVARDTTYGLWAGDEGAELVRVGMPV